MSGDLISRQAVLAALSSRLSIVDMVRVAEIVESVPGVEAEPVVYGRWITHNKGLNNWCECSECYTAGSPFWKRCPVCEAKMVNTE